uniref:SpoIIE family protein phosphatase n=1 Tax=Roseihalotalea indica TaxID=2867963 RepID=A0AA49JE38_9BACT|nr:SpoIIE family protein phosphatase [Tunicatimonas sp. TK19036]
MVRLRIHKNVIRLSLFLGITSWIALVVGNLIMQFAHSHQIASGVTHELRSIFLCLFLVSVFIYYRFITGRAERVNFIDLLWRVFATGLLATIVSLTIKLFYMLLGNSPLSLNPLLYNFFFHIRFGLFVAFIISTLMVWKQLILYQKSKRLIMMWRIFEYGLLISTAYTFLPAQSNYNLFLFVLVPLLILGIVLSANLKWVAYLDFRQKWKSITIMLAIAIFIIYYGIDLYNILDDSGDFQDRLPPELAILILNPFILAALGFTLIYSIFSLLVIIFNLPTSSVFEQKLEEIINFQRLSQSSQSGYDTGQVYDILLESAVKAVYADAGWIETVNDSTVHLLTRHITKERVEIFKKRLQANTDQPEIINPLPRPRLQKQDFEQRRRKHRILKLPEYRSVLWIPLIVKNNIVGTLVLLKEVSDGFNKEMVSIITTFASQASISVENFQLLNETLVNERYQEELKIANRVHRSLLPNKPISNDAFDVAAFSEAADQVGGDYYDQYQINDHKFIIIIGDVSGKGTSAAFNMSQMKGVFHSLAQLDLPPDTFLAYANGALGRCMEKTSFITASFFVVDTQKRTISFARAGHTPTLYYDAKKKAASYLEIRGLGLGIIRNNKFNQYIEVNERAYDSGDIVVLYTDGITEATNEQSEEFGFDRLREVIEKSPEQSPKILQKNLIEELYAFCNHRPLDDDYTALIIKFK